MPRGNYRSGFEKGPGTYTVQVAQLGFDRCSERRGRGERHSHRVDLDVSPVNVDASIGKRLTERPWSRAEFGDIVIENKHLAMAIAKVFNDPQTDTSRRQARSLDMAVTGQPDQLDWINLPYVSTTEPTGGNAWQQLQVRSTDVRIVENTGEKAVVQATGTSAENPNLKMVTTYTATADEQFITAATTFTNATGAPLTVWAGDALDHDGAGSRSAVSGNASVTSGGPFAQTPDARRWIGQSGTGADNQTYGLVYDTASGPFTGYSQAIWTMSKFKLDLPAAGSHTITRRIVAAPNGGATDKFAVLNPFAF